MDTPLVDQPKGKTSRTLTFGVGVIAGLLAGGMVYCSMSDGGQGVREQNLVAETAYCRCSQWNNQCDVPCGNYKDVNTCTIDNGFTCCWYDPDPNSDYNCGGLPPQ